MASLGAQARGQNGPFVPSTRGFPQLRIHYVAFPSILTHNTTTIKMAYRRHWRRNSKAKRLSHEASSSRGQSSARDGTHTPQYNDGASRASATPRQSFARMSSVSHTVPDPSSPSIRPQKRVSLRLPPTQTRRAATATPAPEGPEEEEDEVDIQRREDADALNEVIMAIDMKERGTLGCAYYIAREEKLCLMEDIQLANLELVDMLKLHAQPTVLLISSRAEEALEDHLTKEARPIDRGEDDSMSTITASPQGLN